MELEQRVKELEEEREGGGEGRRASAGSGEFSLRKPAERDFFGFVFLCFLSSVSIFAAFCLYMLISVLLPSLLIFVSLPSCSSLLGHRGAITNVVFHPLFFIFASCSEVFFSFLLYHCSQIFFL